jgi:two-component system, OmpR family, phosphate regulon sensor histidine kinase PhoR
VRLGLRGKLFLTIVGIVALVVAVGAVILPRGIERSLMERTERELDHETALTALYLPRELRRADVASADGIADRLGAMLGNRVTIVLADGRVVGDSELSREAVAAIENHASHPEVREALRTGKGRATRYSTTLGHDLMYVAQRFPYGESFAVVRVSKSLAEVRDASRALYGLLALAGIVGLAIAFVVAAISSHLFSRALRALVEYAERAQDGARRPAVASRQDEIGGLASSVQRLADRLEQQVSELAAERHRFEEILEGMSEALIALDEHRRVTLINRAAVVLLGQTAPTVGRTLLEIVRVPELNALLDGVAPGGEITSEFDLGAVSPRRVLARAKRREPGDYVVVLLDVTELRRLENLRRDFVANVSHELRTPVSIIKANAETLLDGALEDPDAARRFLASVATHADRLANLISDLLDISRLEEGKYELKRERSSVDAAFRRVFAALETQAAEKGTAIRLEPSGALFCACDVRALDQVLFNLVDNAIKYSPGGSAIYLRAANKAGGVLLEVEDDGPGIEPDHRDRLFERFYRVDPGRSREMGGTGLGLAIVKHLVTAMGGRVGMRPAKARGAIFWVSLPAALGSQ